MFNFTKSLILATSLCLVPACADSGMSEDGESLASAEQKLSYSTYTPVNGDSRGYTADSDWSSGFWKGECALNQILSGVSRSYSNQTSPQRMHKLLCLTVNGNMNPTVTLNIGGSDYRRDSSTGDWDSGYVKAECDWNEAMSGISQDANGVLKNGRCVSTMFQRNTCHTVQFLSGDNRYSSDGGDWDSTYQKNQCGSGENVKGVSVSSNGKIKSILCCTYSQIPL
jgi:hypothetical protein